MEGSLGACLEWENINGGEMMTKDGAQFTSYKQMSCAGASTAHV